MSNFQTGFDLLHRSTFLKYVSEILFRCVSKFNSNQRLSKVFNLLAADGDV